MLRLPGLLVLACIGLVVLFAGASASAADYPTPSIYPVAWQLDFTHSKPQRIVVQSPADVAPVAYWYVTYTVTNNTDREQLFIPLFEMLLDDGRVVRGNQQIAPSVYQAIKDRERNNKFLESPLKLGEEIRIGEDQAVDSIAVWREPRLRMGHFSIFVGGLSGETAAVKNESGEALKDAEGNPIILRKTLQLNYFIRGDELFAGQDEVNEEPETWVMR